jgi:hypothetical protein
MPAEVNGGLVGRRVRSARHNVHYVALIGGLMAQHRRHPELIEAFRTHVLLPRRAFAKRIFETEIAAGARWRDRQFALWWEWARAADGLVTERSRESPAG